MSACTSYKINVKHIEKIVIDENLKSESIKITCDSLVELFKDKLIKISKIIKSCNICVVNDKIIINDYLSVVHDLDNILEDFGFTVDRLESEKIGLRGKTYAIGEDSIEILKLLKAQINIEKIADEIFDFDNKLLNLINQKEIKFKEISKFDKLKEDELLNKIINMLLNDKPILVEENEKVMIEDEDGNEIGRKFLGKTNNSANYYAKLEILNKIINEQNIRTKENVIKGTKSLITSRAKQMGYSIQEKKTNDKIELVLVRFN